MIGAVTFDYWRTLIWEPPGELERVRIQRWKSILKYGGHSFSEEQLSAAHASAFVNASASWRRNSQYRAEHATTDMLAYLGLSIADETRAALIRGFSQAGLETPLQLAPGVKQALLGLKAAGLRIGIVCDVGLTPSPVLRQHLKRHGLLALFDHWSFSDETGVYKPAAAPFLHACEGLAVEPAHAAHVGDQRRTDVVGARAAGLKAIRYAGIFDDDDATLPSGDILIEHYDDLISALRLG